MRKLAETAPSGGDISAVNGPEWFDVSTKRINRLKAVEDRIGRDIVNSAQAIAERSNKTLWFMTIVLLGLFVFTIAFSIIIARSITSPITKLTCNMLELAQNDKSSRPQGQERQDEIGEMARTVEIFRQNAIKNDELEARQKELEKRAAQEKSAMMVKLADDFDASVGGIVNTVSSASAQLQSTAQSMSEISAQTSDQILSVSTASQQASSNVQTVAAATEEMTGTINEISQQVIQASSVSRQAVEEVGNTGRQMKALAQNANKIGEVVELISGIAEQTNLLALNATIESARAGEAGKGFAVVASEVKQLANQTARATEEISRQIADIQNATKQASVSMLDVGQTIGKIDEISTAIAASMEEQSAATEEIAGNVNLAAIGTQQVNENIKSVTSASQETGMASGEVMSAASELSRQAEYLKVEVEKFIGQVRAS